MKRLRLGMIATLLAVMTLGVAAVHAGCPDRYVAYFEDRQEQCEYFETREDGVCYYRCVVTPNPWRQA